MNKIPYHYKNLPIPGGGYVTGFLFHKKAEQVLYARTDIGGTYRYLYDENRWTSLMDHVTMFDLSESYPVALALDDDQPEVLYIASGIEQNANGLLGVSKDYGASFSYHTIPTMVHGNLNGRGTGNRLICVSKSKTEKILYFASQTGGLLKSCDEGANWSKIIVGGEEYLTFVWASEHGETIVVGTAGVTTKVSEQLRGTGLYVSYDSGAHFEKMPQLENVILEESRMSGYVPQRYDFDGTYLYITCSNTGKNSYVVENGYSCDSGDSFGGRILRYELNQEGRFQDFLEITPEVLLPEKVDSPYSFGFSGISSCEAMKGLVVCSTICKKDGDIIFLSKDYGVTWKGILYDLSVGKLSFQAPYMKPCYNGNHSIIHWMSDIKINPKNPNELWFNSGTGIFASFNLLEDTVCFLDQCNGLEETVHLNIYSPIEGEVQLIDILGDLGGFAFTDVTKPCENTFANEENDRYITCINADFSDYEEKTVIVTPRGNWTGKTKGGLILSKDQCKTFKRLPMPFGISEEIDNKLRGIENPNTNSGWCALSADAKSIVWCIADQITLPMKTVIYSHNQGETFQKSMIYNSDKKLIDDKYMKVYADRVNPKLMYGFGCESDIYVSKDAGAHFEQINVSTDFPVVDFRFIDCANKTEIRGESGKEGVFWMALNQHGLWRMKYSVDRNEIELKKITAKDDVVFRVGLGVLREHGDYQNEDKALYVSAIFQGEYGFYRSLDQGISWECINTKNQMFGDINSMEGDSRIFGRFFIATGSRGVLYGDQC